MSDMAVSSIPFLLAYVLVAIPLFTLFGRVGLSRVWTLLLLVPFGIFVLLWMLAYRKRPNYRQDYASIS